jgi:tRNA(Phe) wybutosine-synthesizing methylase Tyw3
MSLAKFLRNNKHYQYFWVRLYPEGYNKCHLICVDNISKEIIVISDMNNEDFNTPLTEDNIRIVMCEVFDPDDEIFLKKAERINEYLARIESYIEKLEQKF